MKIASLTKTDVNNFRYYLFASEMTKLSEFRWVQSKCHSGIPYDVITTGRVFRFCHTVAPKFRSFKNLKLYAIRRRNISNIQITAKYIPQRTIIIIYLSLTQNQSNI